MPWLTSTITSVELLSLMADHSDYWMAYAVTMGFRPTELRALVLFHRHAEPCHDQAGVWR